MLLVECNRCGTIATTDGAPDDWQSLHFHDKSGKMEVYHFCGPCIILFEEWVDEGLEVAPWLQMPEPRFRIESPRETFDRMDEARDRKRWERDRRYKRERGIN